MHRSWCISHGETQMPKGKTSATGSNAKTGRVTPVKQTKSRSSIPAAGSMSKAGRGAAKAGRARKK
jgi:hypothetical protein